VKGVKGLRLSFEVARVLNMTPDAFQVEQADGRLPLPQLSKFAADEGIELSWLLTGERPVKRKHAATGNLLEIREIRRGQEPKPRRRSGAPETAGREPLSLDVAIQRIKELKGVDSEAAVARLLGMTRQALKREGFPLDHLTRFADREGVSLRWLLTGAVPGENRGRVGGGGPARSHAGRPSVGEHDTAVEPGTGVG
jgi:hypothetical protein